MVNNNSIVGYKVKPSGMDFPNFLSFFYKKSPQWPDGRCGDLALRQMD
jgi:hypothetical protein